MIVPSSEFGVRSENRIQRNDRGVALIIVLLVTALLIALIFEFAYGTRVSLRAAVNFRDSQRAHYLARSGVNFVGRFLSANLQSGVTGTATIYDNLEQREWQVVPFMPGIDTELRVKWDDESGKIRITDVQVNKVRQAMLKSLFENKGINRGVLDEIIDPASDISKMGLLTGLHRFMNDEVYNMISPLLTMNPNVNLININTAPEDVLLSLGLSPGAVSLIVDDRKKAPITDCTNYTPVKDVVLDGYMIKNSLTDKSNDFKVYSYATVGGFTKQVEAGITRSSAGFTVNYWRAL
jgi:type II secretory pathway component PulK